MERSLLKNWLLANKRNYYLKRSCLWLVLFFIFTFKSLFAQINYVNNPSFEFLKSSGPNCLEKVYYWNPLDSTKTCYAGELRSTLLGNAPSMPGIGYCLPHTGNNFIRATITCTNPCGYYLSRSYPKNKLKANLIAGQTYCVKCYVSFEDICPNAIKELQILLGDASLDTIKYCANPLTYLSPQITNTIGIINDTSQWTEIKGTFVANGAEKYLVFGCFVPESALTKSVTGISSGDFAEYFIDDFSVIDFNLSVLAGPDKNINVGDSAFIGRPPEIGLECTWTTGTTTVGIGGGIWVKPPVGTYSYVVTQNICGNIKSDTVNVNVSPGAISENELFAKSIGIYPQPAKDVVNVNLSYYYEPSILVKISDLNGREILNRELNVSQNKTLLNTSELSNGVYILQFSNNKGQTVNKRMVITK